MKKIYKILILAALLLAMAVLVFMFAEEITAVKRVLYSRLSGTASGEETESVEETVDFQELYASAPSFTHSEEAWYQDTQLIYHAGGGIDGLDYSNSKEAIEQALQYSNVLEIDFAYTLDKSLVCLHSWDYITGSSVPLTLEEFEAYKVFGHYTTVTAMDIIDLMKERKELIIVVDTKAIDVFPVVQELIRLAENKSDILDRFVIQLYDKGEKAAFLEMYPFPEENFLFTCYKYGTNHEDILRICLEENISVVTVAQGKWTGEIIDLFTQKGILIYEHTVNRPDQVQQSLENGVHGFYTDFLISVEAPYFPE